MDGAAFCGNPIALHFPRLFCVAGGIATEFDGRVIGNS
jgi:hypothetical protein